MTSFLSDIQLPFPNSNNLNSHGQRIFQKIQQLAISYCRFLLLYLQHRLLSKISFLFFFLFFLSLFPLFFFFEENWFLFHPCLWYITHLVLYTTIRAGSSLGLIRYLLDLLFSQLLWLEMTFFSKKTSHKIEKHS